jgi:hypothetical protein
MKMLRELYSRGPETHNPEPWELQALLWSLDYNDDLLPEDEIMAVVEVARTRASTRTTWWRERRSWYGTP